MGENVALECHTTPSKGYFSIAFFCALQFSDNVLLLLYFLKTDILEEI
jgi:hypothetical protein